MRIQNPQKRSRLRLTGLRPPFDLYHLFRSSSEGVQPFAEVDIDWVPGAVRVASDKGQI